MDSSETIPLKSDTRRNSGTQEKPKSAPKNLTVAIITYDYIIVKLFFHFQ
jgi:hypothetical protein